MSYSILVPLDDSAWSQSAADMAVWIAQHRDDVTITALHVVNVTQVRGRWIEDLAGMLGFEPVVVPDQVEAHFVKRGTEHLERFAARCKQDGVPCRTVLEQGSVVDRIVHLGGRHDLVVMGVRGETEERFPGQGGGSAERVLRRIGSSTLVVPRDQHEIQGITLAFDGSPGAGRALRAVQHLVELIQVPVHIVHVSDRPGPDCDLEPVRQRLATSGVPVTTSQVGGEPQEALPAETVQRGFDLLAMGYRGRSRIRDIFLGRTTEWLVGHVHLGMLIAR